MRDRWTERDRKLKANATEKTTQTSASVSPAGTPAHADGTASGIVGQTPTSSGNVATSSWSDVIVAASPRDGRALDRNSRESSLSYY